MSVPLSKVIVIGGGLAGLSSAHTILEQGGNVLILDKNSFMGGNSTKATSGINGAVTRTQIEKGIKDSRESFLKDTITSADGGNPNAPTYPLAEVLVNESAPAVEWLIDSFGLDLSLLGRLGGHSFPRTHRGKERFPGMTITYALMEKFEAIAAAEPNRAQVITKATATSLIKDNDGSIIGVEYTKGGQTFKEYGAVVIATGGYGADFSENSLLKTYRPDIMHLPTTNGDHCSGDGIKMAIAVGAGTKDMDKVQVHPTGLVHPDEPDAKVKFLAAEALRGCGALLLDGNGKRFCNELGRRDYVSGEMFANKGPYRLVLNGASSREIEWHCKHYVGRGLMKHFEHGKGLADDMGIPVSVLKQTFDDYNKDYANNSDKFGKKFFHNGPYSVDDYFNVAIVTPVIHYCMGGLYVSSGAEVLSENGTPVKGLYCTGEVMGGVHGKNRLGGSSLLDCVVYGRVSGRNVSKYMMQKALKFQQDAAQGRLSNVLGHIAGVTTTVKVCPQSNHVTLDFSWGSNGAPASVDSPVPTQSAAAPAPVAAPAAAPSQKEYTAEEVAKHKTEKDCWVVVNGQVLNVTEFLPEHPGGKKAIMLFAGKDASEEFNMLHKKDVVEKYAPESIIGTLKK